MKNISDIIEFGRFDQLEIIAREVVEGFITGMHRSPFHGFSVEFAEHRLYNTGESTKHIDWKLFARTEKLFVKRFEEETNLRSHLVIDTSSSMLFPERDKKTVNKLTFAAFCAAAFIYLLRKQRDAVGLTLLSNEIELHTPAKISMPHAKVLYAELAKLIANNKNNRQKTTKLAQNLHQIAESIHKRSMVIIFSDMMDFASEEEIFSALEHLKYNKHEVILFHVTDHQHELNFSYQNRPYRFIDMETGDEIKLNPNDIRQGFETAAAQRRNDLKLRCGQYKIDFVEADINGNFADLLLPYLSRRKHLM